MATIDFTALDTNYDPGLRQRPDPYEIANELGLSGAAAAAARLAARGIREDYAKLNTDPLDQLARNIGYTAVQPESRQPSTPPPPPYHPH